MQKENVKFTRVSRSQVLAYFTAKGMKGAAEEVAAKLEKHLPGKLARRLKQALQQSKASPVEHGVMGVILGVLVGKGGAYMLLEQLRTKQLQGLLMSMGHAPSNMLASDYERAILELWADQVCFLRSACTKSHACLKQFATALRCFLYVILTCYASSWLEFPFGPRCCILTCHCTLVLWLKARHGSPA